MAEGSPAGVYGQSQNPDKPGSPARPGWAAHREQTYGTLWSNIDVGLGSRPFDSSGNGNYRGLHAGAYSTFW